MPVLRNIRVLRWKLVAAAAVLETALAGVYLLWRYLRSAPFPGWPTGHHLSVAVLCCLPLLAVNIVLYLPAVSRLAWTRTFFIFKEEVICRLAAPLDTASALTLALFAGLGEELFFRGVLQQELGILISSAVFAGLHFGTAVRKFPYVAAAYVVVSLYLGAIFAYSGSLWPPVFTHALYDFLLLFYLCNFDKSCGQARLALRGHEAVEESPNILPGL